MAKKAEKEDADKKINVSVEDNGFELQKTNEWSLEFNVMSELKELAESVWWFINPPISPKDWTPELPWWHYWVPKLPGRTTFTMYKPHPIQENALGYDIHLKPVGTGNDSRSLLIQFKRDKLIEKDRKKDLEEIEKRVEKEDLKIWEEKHYAFTINDNGETKAGKVTKPYNQHLTFANHKDLASCLYAFPLIKDKEEQEKYAGRLVLRTKFLSVNEIDTEASAELAKQGVSREEFWSEEHRVLFEQHGNSWMLNYYYYYYYYYYFANPSSLVVDVIMLNLIRALKSINEKVGIIYSEMPFADLRALVAYIGVYCGIDREKIMEKFGINSDYFDYALADFVKSQPSMDALMKKQGNDIWTSFIDALKLEESLKATTPGELLAQIGNYDFQVLQSLKDDLKISVEGDSMKDLSAYIL